MKKYGSRPPDVVMILTKLIMLLSEHYLLRNERNQPSVKLSGCFRKHPGGREK